MSKILEATTLEALQCFNGKVDAADSSMDDANCSLPPRKPSRAKSRDQNAASPKSSTEVISGLTDVLSVQMETIVSHILNSPKEFKIPDSDTSTRAFIVNLAQYARKLEGMSNPVTSGVAPSSNPIAVSHSPTVPVKKTAKQIEAVADKLGRAAKSGIKKQMSGSRLSSNIHPSLR
ncbi:uncharacterized protein EI90DRAFT_3035676 [Cantharellus anzutake]|uniref:uncharacterized protein n=1 Tax=Cantharellus anzutake TaxID=1750568 RepID=UPI0019070023|nr:uncharacterized protein EI90DRAFT_3035676 [Cantharellus anzutake]KAF8340463.1 hypothetical protein EI90DRAFT_3035676 [Cantharellus anzutake]